MLTTVKIYLILFFVFHLLHIRFVWILSYIIPKKNKLFYYKDYRSNSPKTKRLKGIYRQLESFLNTMFIGTCWQIFLFNIEISNAWFFSYYRCICGGTDLNIEKDQIHSKGHSQRQCLGYHAIVVLKAARTTSIIQELSHWKTSGHFKLTSKESMVPSHLCAENAARHLQWKEIGEPMKRIAASCGIVLVVLISSTRDHLRTILGHLAKAILLTHPLMDLKMRRSASPLAPKMKLLAAAS